MIRPLQKSDIDLAYWDFEYQQRAEQPILLCDFFSRSLEQHLISSITGTQEHCNYLFTDSDKGYMYPPHRDRAFNAMCEKVKTREGLHEVLRLSFEVPHSFNELADAANAIANNPGASAEEVANLWRGMDDTYIRVIPWFYYPWYLSKENILTDRVKAGLEKYRPQIEAICDFDEALMVVVFPVKKTAFQLEQDELLGLVQLARANSQFKDDEAFKAKAKEYLRKYDWLTTFILTPLYPMTYEQLAGRVEKALSEKYEETLAKQKETLQKNEALAERLMSLLEGDSELADAIADARELGWVLTAGIEEAYMSSARYLPFMQSVAKRIEVEYTDLKYLLSAEIEEAVRTGAKIDQRVVQERKGGFVMMNKDGERYAAFGALGHELSALVDAHFSKVDMNVTELRGRSACKGEARGKARVALSPEEAHLLETGEILVVPMTNPDYVPAMRRSGAIVTDEGGLLSHAAIMSREFGKPCVIGTKDATRMLKTGDLLEVDATAGIVKIIERIARS